MKIESKVMQGVTVLTLAGMLNLTEGIVPLRSAILSASGAGQNNIVLNFSQVSKIDSSAVGELFRANDILANMGGRICICEPTEKMAQLIKITELNGRIQMYNTQAEAIASYQDL